MHVEKFPTFLPVSVTDVLSSSINGSLSHYCRPPPSAPHKPQPLQEAELTIAEPGGRAGLVAPTEDSPSSAITREIQARAGEPNQWLRVCVLVQVTAVAWPRQEQRAELIPGHPSASLLSPVPAPRWARRVRCWVEVGAHRGLERPGCAWHGCRGASCPQGHTLPTRPATRLTRISECAAKPQAPQFC